MGSSGLVTIAGRRWVIRIKPAPRINQTTSIPRSFMTRRRVLGICSMSDTGTPRKSPTSSGRFIAQKRCNRDDRGLAGPIMTMIGTMCWSWPNWRTRRRMNANGWATSKEGGLGANSVTLYRVDKTWYMLWAENQLATSSSLTGKFSRLPEGALNPVTFQRPRMIYDPAKPGEFSYLGFWIENPIVTVLPATDGRAATYLMLAGFSLIPRSV